MKPIIFSCFLQIAILSSMAILSWCQPAVGAGTAAPIRLDALTLPRGFRISLFTQEVPNARSMTVDEEGTVYVASMNEGKVYIVKDRNSDGTADNVDVLASGLNMPNGVAYWNGSLYIAEISRIIKYDDVKHLDKTKAIPEVVYADFPKDVHHGWKYLRVGPDQKLYTAIGAPCNICLSDKALYATIVRLDLAGKNLEIYARGVRNTVGFDWHPDTHLLWFTDNGRDWLGDDAPPDELNQASAPDLHFGYPFCHGDAISDPQFGQIQSCSAFTPPAWKFPAHVAALGARFYTGKQFPSDYQGRLFVAQHGSWNRSTKQGYRVVSLRFENGRPVEEQVFIQGWLKANGDVTGRPVDILQMPDGALLISDDKNGALYRVTYSGRE